MFVIYVTTTTKRRLIQQAAERQRSLSAEVVILLLERYRPDGWEALAADVAHRSRLRNNRPEAIDDGQPETIGLVLPDALRESVQREGRKNYRSLNAEIVHFLEGEENQHEHIFRR